MKRWIGGTLAAAVVVGGSVVGAGVASADDGGSGGVDRVCTERIPKALARIDTLTARIDGDVSTKGSTAWLRDRAEKVRATGHPALADLLEQRAASRPQKAQELAALQTQLLDIQAKDCA